MKLEREQQSKKEESVPISQCPSLDLIAAAERAGLEEVYQEKLEKQKEENSNWFTSVPTFQLRVISTVFSSIDPLEGEEAAVFLAVELELSKRAEEEAKRTVEIREGVNG